MGSNVLRVVGPILHLQPHSQPTVLSLRLIPHLLTRRGPERLSAVSKNQTQAQNDTVWTEKRIFKRVLSQGSDNRFGK